MLVSMSRFLTAPSNLWPAARVRLQFAVFLQGGCNALDLTAVLADQPACLAPHARLVSFPLFVREVGASISHHRDLELIIAVADGDAPKEFLLGFRAGHIGEDAANINGAHITILVTVHRPGQPTSAIAPIERVFLTGTRSAESIMASGHEQCRINRPNTWQWRAPTEWSN